MRLINADDIPYTMLYKEDFMKHTGYEAQAVWKKDIDALPTVDAMPVVHGEWIIRDNPGTGWYRVTCSECGEDVTATAPCIGFFPNAKVIWNYCPECGADMRGEQDGCREEE